jgi:hypothetical protein
MAGPTSAGGQLMGVPATSAHTCLRVLREDDGVDEAADGFSGLQNTRFHFFPANGQAIRAGALVTGAEA